MSEGTVKEYWAARDSDGWEWIFDGEPDYSNEVWDQQEKWQALYSAAATTIACSEVPPSHKRKLKSLDLVKGTVEYEGEAIHGGGP